MMKRWLLILSLGLAACSAEPASEWNTLSGEPTLVRVHAAGFEPGVWHLMTGLPYLIRIMGYGLRAPRDRVRGNDFAGRIEAVGKNVIVNLFVGDVS